jgi:cytochrome subunit of sulfide dehydrogenase
MSKFALVLLCGTALGTCQAAFAGGTIGRTIGVTCAGCHGPDGRSLGAIPSLSGMTASEIESAMLAFREDKRPATIMNRIARGYTNNDIAVVAEYFANLK